MAVRSPPHNDSVVYLWKGECHIAQHQTESILGLTERGEMDKIILSAIGYHPIRR